MNLTMNLKYFNDIINNMFLAYSFIVLALYVLIIIVICYIWYDINSYIDKLNSKIDSLSNDMISLSNDMNSLSNNIVYVNNNKSVSPSYKKFRSINNESLKRKIFSISDDNSNDDSSNSKNE